MSFTETFVTDLAERAGLKIFDRFLLPARNGTLCDVPVQLSQTIRTCLLSRYPQGLYKHQGDAIIAALGGQDICLSTATASGKSLVFMAVAAQILETDPASRILALYPAKALIQDQIDKWVEMLQPLNMRPGYVDGSVPIDRRSEILRDHRVVLMTPDVVHAWLMSHPRERGVSILLENLRLLILDEAHVYDGVFGTNMAYFLRRLEFISARYRMICSTATLGKPADFVQQLTGRQPLSFGLTDDYSSTPPKKILLAKDMTGKTFDSMVSFLASLGRAETGRFLAFGDSRRMVEQVVAAAHRTSGNMEEEELSEEEQQPSDLGKQPKKVGALSEQRVLPYRAGYENEDRDQIQKALTRGQLAGVVSTSAMELGLDIGEIDLIVMLGIPPSVKAFWQRLGRGGRRNPGVCLLIDNRGAMAGAAGGLKEYLERPLEPSWLYLENRYAQYAHALCTAFEMKESGTTKCSNFPFALLPADFRRFLENELNPTEIVPNDLYPLKQRAEGGPHREFPLRSGIEMEFRVTTPQGLGLGTLTFSQALREAYPGAIYYYMARPYRVYRFDYKKGSISARREKHWITRPLSQTKVFPRFQGGIFKLFSSEVGFVAETEMQVSERVLGFTEQRGSAKPEQHRYGPSSSYSRRELSRFFETTGVCWYFPPSSVLSEELAAHIQQAFCLEFGVQDRDLGVGLFHSKQSPLGHQKCQGVCVYDSTNGSLRLTQRLAEKFADVGKAAISIAQNQGDAHAVRNLEELLALVNGLGPVPVTESAGPVRGTEDNWAVIIADGEKAMYLSEDGAREVEIVRYRYTPQGLMYELVSPQPNTKWMVSVDVIRPMHGATKMVRVNLLTGETELLSQGDAKKAAASDNE